MSPKSLDVVVVFRVFNDGGDVIALMPQQPWDLAGNCTSYQRIGQHGAANYAHVVMTSRPAAPAEYAALLSELETVGYGILVRVRAGRCVTRAIRD